MSNGRPEPGGGGTPYNLSFFDRIKRLHIRPYLDMHVVDHCNLRCAGCVHYSPLAGPRFYDPEAIAHDLGLLAAVPGVEDFFEALCIMGGEPTLHPRLPEILRLSRERLPHMTLFLDTNGLLLRRMPDEFWRAMAEADIRLVISPYPVGVDYPPLVELAEAHGVRAALAGDVTGSERGKEVFFHIALDEHGTQDPTYASNRCPFGGNYVQLHNGALYPCQVAAYHATLNAEFGTALASSDDDRLPLESITSTEQIDTFRRSAHPMCRFCDNDQLAVDSWRRSRRERSEWFAQGTATRGGCSPARP